MRLYLSSYRLGSHEDRVLELLQGGRRAAIIENALDYIPDEARRKYQATVYDPKGEFSNLGIAAESLDLKHYFGDPDGLETTLNKFDLVWVLGGNSFLLRRAMKQSGFDHVIARLLRDDAIVYGGFSAGAVVMAPTLKGIDLMDDPEQLAADYDPEIVWEGLGIVDFSIVPHYRSDHSERETAENAVRFFEQSAMPFRAISDGEVIVVKDGTITLLPISALSSQVSEN
ncbi:type 1 glutamine amidotransferase-like domain-containing protein [Agrobacterium rhizogenes]|nr:type 1 glutamine amidotransferase-like domain-containing protein [Rhizobium rhizogenes]NTI94107.1 type 1 glutamine amidotransferase-like domain-containing protein [Rhizobium rhizogenes]NTJ56574.1 type 1 glutamine amidotransferase-like domain-containing protein [Rhizobium rhizogenes]OCJ31054.1 peptidase E [Agrobacterium sp. B133/95]